MFGRARRRVATAAASLLGSVFKILLVTAGILLAISHSTRAQSPSVFANSVVAAPQSLQVPSVAVDYRADTKSPMPH